MGAKRKSARPPVLSTIPSRRGISTFRSLPVVRGLQGGTTGQSAGDFVKGEDRALVCKHCGNVIDGKTAVALGRIAKALGTKGSVIVAWCLRCRPEGANDAKKEEPKDYARYISKQRQG